MKISVFGTGYVGLVTGACLADVGHEVCCADTDASKVAQLRRGEVPIFEPGLDHLVTRNCADGRLTFTTEGEEATDHGDLIFIAVGTPPDEDGSADLRHVLAVARTIGTHMTGPKIVINKSTVPVGTGELVRAEIAKVLKEREESIDFDVCSNPEFLKEGMAIEDFSKGSRIVVGTDSERVREAMRRCYAPYNRNHDKLMFMDLRSAELTKYAANGMLATKISFMNEIANLAEKLGADVEQVRRGIGSDPRIGYHFIYPGCGYGGSCFPKDVKALARAGREAGYDPALLAAVETVNERQKGRLYEKLSQAFDGQLKNCRIAVWGLAFKPNTDDMREAPSRVLIDAVLEAGGSVNAYDPAAMEEARSIYGSRPEIVFADSPMQAVEDCDALVICTEWKEFRVVDFRKLKDALSRPVIVDGRNLYDPEEASQAGFLYYAIGRGASIEQADATRAGDSRTGGMRSGTGSTGQAPSPIAARAS